MQECPAVIPYLQSVYKPPKEGVTPLYQPWPSYKAFTNDICEVGSRSETHATKFKLHPAFTVNGVTQETPGVLLAGCLKLDQVDLSNAHARERAQIVVTFRGSGHSQRIAFIKLPFCEAGLADSVSLHDGDIFLPLAEVTDINKIWFTGFWAKRAKRTGKIDNNQSFRVKPISASELWQRIVTYMVAHGDFTQEQKDAVKAHCNTTFVTPLWFDDSTTRMNENTFN